MFDNELIISVVKLLADPGIYDVHKRTIFRNVMNPILYRYRHLSGVKLLTIHKEGIVTMRLWTEWNKLPIFVLCVYLINIISLVVETRNDL